MPKNVDHSQRRRDIIRAANEVIAGVGLRGLSFRAVANRLGGSTTFVTHYYSSRRELLDGFATALIESWERELEDIERGEPDPRARLRLLLEWMIPLTPAARVEERARINLLAERNLGDDVRFMFQAWELKMRALLREHLECLVPGTMVELRVDSLRVVTNGLVLSSVEHPERWPRERLLTTLHQALADMDLLGPTQEVDGAGSI